MRFKLFVLRLLKIDNGPWIIPVKDYWIFVDRFQQIWEIREAAQPDNPFVITLKER